MFYCREEELRTMNKRYEKNSSNVLSYTEEDAFTEL